MKTLLLMTILIIIWVAILITEFTYNLFYLSMILLITIEKNIYIMLLLAFIIAICKAVISEVFISIVVVSKNLQIVMTILIILNMGGNTYN
jgi:hypothetical protein